MKRLFNILFASLLLLQTACQRVEVLVEPEIGQNPSGPEFIAQVEEFLETQTKTALVNGNSVVWSAGDQITVFQGTAVADKYQVNDDCVGTTSGTFGIVAKGEAAAEETFNANIAIYPYQDGLAVTSTSATEYKITGVTIPSTQTYTANTFSNGSFLMAAITDGLTDHTLSFRNLCGALKLQLKGTAKIKSIEFKGNDGEPLSGDATVTIHTNSTVPSLTMTKTAVTTVTLDCGAGVQLNETTATDFLIAIPPTAFEKGFTVVVTTVDGGIAKLETAKSNAVQRSYVHVMPEITVEPQYDPAREHYRGKRLWVFGDSITAGVGTTSPYYFSQILCDNLGFASLKRLGNSGYAFSHGIDDYGYTILDKVESSLKSAPGNCDVLIICFGVNDWTWGRNIEGDRAIGAKTDDTKYTICGAVNQFCQKLQTLFADYPDVEIYFSTPTPTKNAPISGGNPSGKSWDQSKQNYNGNTLRDICDAIAERATAYGYGVLDLNRYFAENINGSTNLDEVFPDGLHPNEAGNELIASVLEDLLLNSYDSEEDKTYTPHVELGALSTLGVWAKNFYDRQYYRTPRYMRVTDSAVEVAVQEECDVRVCQYDADFKFIKIIDFTQVMASEGKTFKLDASCEYIRLVFRKDSSLPQFEKPEVYVKNVEAKEYFEPRPADDGYQKILAHVEVDGQILPDYGVVCLPETYSNVGEPTRLIIFCHGAAVNYPSSVSRFVASDINPEYWLKEGYAIMDIEGNPFDNTNEHFYIPQAIQCYKAAYDWVTTTYNIRTDGVFLGGRSMGGGMCFEILRSDIPVIAACPVVPACNQLWYWNYADAGRKKFCSEKMGFTGTQPAWTSSKKLTDAEYDYLYANFDKMLSCSPFWSGIENLPSKDELFSVGRVSANAAYDEAEANLYSTLKFRAKAPVKIFTCYEDNTVPYQRNAQLMYNMMVNAGMECELSLVHTDASTPHRYEQQDSNANITVTTRFGETMSAPWVYVDMVKFWRKYE